MATPTELSDFQAVGIEKSDHDRTIKFKGEWITIFNRTTKDTPTDRGSNEAEQEFDIKTGYECILHGGGPGSYYKVSDKTT
ncbi:hypothetical protein CJF32_00002936 [Rutstroemia sp. NJR-2017a WRK4]|jgi:hypothetical protein|nr:hypothetical protein CJF32_00002936 [Rutstroemia sp. NJR-2017a WRK4]PQE26674.1 hypothetical protein CJF30_00011274 [Rutstroemia sp. NJR-2017a BBW]